MRAVLALIFRSIVRTRVGLTALLLVVVVSVVGVGRLRSAPGGAHRPPLGATTGQKPVLATEPTAGDDGVRSMPPPPEPVTSPGGSPPVVIALAFANAWIDHRGVSPEQWHSALRPYATVELVEKLTGVDPIGVPADRLTGEPALIPHAANLVEVVIEMDAGKLRLRLTGPAGRWLVDGVDWDRA